MPGQSVLGDGGSSPALRVACPKCKAYPYRYCVREDGSTQITAHKLRRELAERERVESPGLAQGVGNAAGR